MTPQTTAAWAREMAALAWLKRQTEKTWPNTVHAIEVGPRAAQVPGLGGRPPA